MYTRSIIQQQIENIQTNSILESEIEHIMEQFTIEDGVFGMLNNKPIELTAGYFIESNSYNTLNECIRNMKPGQAIRIVENKQFILGEVCSSLADCPRDENCSVFDIEFLEKIR